MTCGQHNIDRTAIGWRRVEFQVNADLHTVLRTADVQQRFGELVIEIAPGTREEFSQFMRAEHLRWARVIKEAGIPQQ